MKASRYTDPQKAFILKQGEDGMAVAEVCRKGRDHPGDLLQWEEEVRWADALGDETSL